MTVVVDRPHRPLTFDTPRTERASGFGLLDAVSAVIALAMVAASAGGLWLSDLYHDNTWSKAFFRGTDLATLLFAVPTLLVAVALARRGSTRARLVWLGVLAYNVYNYAFYLFGTAFNDFFLLYAALLGSSIITLVFAAPRTLRLRVLVESARVRLVSGYMLVVGVMFGAMWTAASLAYVINDELPKSITDSGIHTNIVFALDLTLIVPAFVIGAVALWRRQPTGVLLAVVMNIVGVLYMAALAFAGGFQADAGIKNSSWSAPPYLEIGITSLLAVWLLFRNTTRRPELS
jgi:hypothetical protein